MSTPHNQTGRLSPQSMLQQRYIIIEQAGRGGMGAVYLATDTRIANRRIAIKEMSQAHLNDEELPQATARFQQEAAMLGSLSHPNLPRIYDAFSEQERSYLVMDYIEGKTLYQILKEVKGQPLPVAQVLLYARQLCDVLSYLHQQNPPIIFRDVKPTNVMVTKNGHIYLIDFGIARFFKEGQEQDTILLGSPGYAPPEQHGIAQTNPRSDLYGLGATLHYCLTGQDPYAARDHFTFPPIHQYNSQVPFELDQLISSMIATDERKRPASALEVQQTLLKINQQAAEHTSALHPTYRANAAAPTQYIPPKPARNPSAPEQPATITVPPRAIIGTPSHLTQAVSQPASPSPWTGGFSTAFGLLFVLTVGISMLALNFVCPSVHLLETGLSFILAIVAFFATVIVGGIVPRIVMFVTGLFTFGASFVFFNQSQPDLSSGIHFTNPSATCTVVVPLTQAQSSNLLLTLGLALAALLSLYWLTHHTSWSNRGILLALFGIAIIATALQFSFADADPLKHILLLIALITLIQGTLLVGRLEHAQKDSQFSKAF